MIEQKLNINFGMKLISSFQVELLVKKKKAVGAGKELSVVLISPIAMLIIYIYIYDTQYYTAIKIKDRIATFVLPYDAYEVDSVAININNNRIEKYFKDGVLLTERPISFESAYIAESDLKTCN
ncbi:hypothetical protein JGH11_15660 [Dysgonomonas sp. Marseille-P4677]|uniref:hypothetical protein n=1 Tax=Dysgonomonas sp. Marseille-P4677 TaxID=2364790 RepID=UPI0019148CAE|nr:hypothetical protein [Dysgonomonas sp. Marseille-P4677]MBK5722311.1 hypothetical protein [Dysgonomonas sp. Marseille-P4677]